LILDENSVASVELPVSIALLYRILMPTDWERREEALESIRQALKGDPTNLELANRYWKALDSARSGRDVIVAYRESALISGAGAAAFARAYRELFDVSGEAPRLPYFDQPLIEALQNSLSKLLGTDRENVQWILRSIGAMPPSAQDC
jgi:hypothetical protein